MDKIGSIRLDFYITDVQIPLNACSIIEVNENCSLLLTENPL